MATAITGDKIFLYFAWEGPTKLDGDDVGMVRWNFGGPKKYGFVLPKDINPVAARTFSIISRTYHPELGTILTETHSDVLSVAIVRMRNLIIRAGIIKNIPIGPMVVNPNTREVIQQQINRISNEKIHLIIPKNLEKGQTYTLVFSSNGASLSGRFVKAAEPSLFDKVMNERIQQVVQECSMYSSDLLQTFYRNACRTFETLKAELSAARLADDTEQKRTVQDLASRNIRLLIDYHIALKERGIQVQLPGPLEVMQPPK